MTDDSFSYLYVIHHFTFFNNPKKKKNYLKIDQISKYKSAETIKLLEETIGREIFITLNVARISWLWH